MEMNYCPLLLAGWLSNNNDLHPICNCQEQDCAWYNEKRARCGLLVELIRIGACITNKGQPHE